jgi:integrase
MAGGAVMTSTTKTITESAEEYLTFRRGLGFQLKTEGNLVLKFAAFADREHSGSVTTQLALQWACLPEGAAPLYCARRLEIVRCFTRFLAIFDEGTEIPPQGLLGRAHRRIAPHIYSDREISDLVAAAGQLSSRCGLRPRTFQALFGILASTGLRISEALTLQTSSLDRDQQLFVVERTKFRKSRLVPLHPTVAAQLESYTRFRDQQLPLAESGPLLVSDQGSPLKYSTVRGTFRALCQQLDWKSNGGRQRPRLYDFRHTFACRRLLQWYRDGIEIDHAISALSTYMGHVRVTDTYWYLTGTSELLRAAAERFESLARTAGKEQQS